MYNGGETIFREVIKMGVPDTSITLGSIEGQRALAKALFKIKENWDLKFVTLSKILRKNRSSLKEWESDGSLPLKVGQPAIEILQHFLAIYRSLSAMFSASSDQIAWLNSVHPQFGKAPIDMMSESLDGLITIRKYLDYVRGRGA